MKDGYPDRVCDYCHLQLNTFHAFVKKAKKSSDQFAKIIEDVARVDLIEDIEPERELDLKAESVSMMLMEFDVESDETEAINAHNLGADLDLIINKEENNSMGAHELENDSKWYKKYGIRIKNVEKL